MRMIGISMGSRGVGDQDAMIFKRIANKWSVMHRGNRYLVFGYLIEGVDDKRLCSKMGRLHRVARGRVRVACCVLR